MAIQILEQVPLAPFTTMRVGGNARFFARVGNREDLREVLVFAQDKNLPIFILGNGSNIVVSDSGFSGMVIKIEFKGIEHGENLITVGAGENWDDVVEQVVSRGLWGFENLSLIPGSVGGAIVQNIGAYGIEVCDKVFSVEAFDIKTMQLKNFSREKCAFGYRESFFKKSNNFIVTSVSFALSRNGEPNINYEDVKKFFEDKKIANPNLQEIRDAIVAIRTAKMPAFPIGTAGSFFKNPVVSFEQYEELKKQFPEIKAYLQGDNTVKLAAAWLLDHVGSWRGVRRGDAGVHEKQPLILVNYGRARAEEILNLASEMKKNIKEKTNVTLEEEVVQL